MVSSHLNHSYLKNAIMKRKPKETITKFTVLNIFDQHKQSLKHQIIVIPLVLALPSAIQQLMLSL